MITGNSGTYAKLIPTDDTREKIALIMTLFNLENYTSPYDLHVTVIYSRKECPTIDESFAALPVTATGKAFSIFTNADGGNCLVVELESEGITNLHNSLINEHGATHDYDSYNPHITLSYDYNSKDVPSTTMLEHFFNLRFDKFVVVPLHIEWENK